MTHPPMGPATPTPPPGPRAPSNAELLDLIDHQLISLLAVAYFGPAEKSTAASVDQACAAEILLFRLRAARRAVRDLRDAYGIKPPARPVPPTTPPVGLGSNHPLAPGERLVPGSGAATRSAVTESGSAVVAAVAGAPNPPSGSEGGRAGGARLNPGAVQDFGLPRPPRFSMREGERRLYGYVDLPAQQVGVAEYRGRP